MMPEELMSAIADSPLDLAARGHPRIGSGGSL
jgi:hypothetical protein